MDSIVVAGATGFVGHAVAQRLAERFRVIGLTRGRKEAKGAWAELRTCDLFNLRDVERAFEGARYVAYLVHSMLPSARLVQGNFQDLDLICADNVGRAAAKLGIEQIVYLGGLIPADDAKLSEHLKSRREVEAALGAHGAAVTTLRAGIVIGPHGSSFEILHRLVKRLPAMVLPSWTERKCQPIDLGTVAACVDKVVGARTHYNQTYDLGGPDVLKYREMLAIVAEELHQHRPALRIPFAIPRISRAWVSTITGAPKALVKPLVESLRHDMVARDTRLQGDDLPGLTFRAAVAGSIATPHAQPQAYNPAPPAPVSGVRSVQRIALPKRRDAHWAAQEYMRWLPRGAWPIHVDSDEKQATFSLFGFQLLTLDFAKDRSGADRQLFFVRGGLLSNGKGRLEFRQTPDGEHLLTAIHDFAPRLPWFVYRWTQALVHMLVMWRFGRHLLRMQRLDRIEASRPDRGVEPARHADDDRHAQRQHQ